MAKRAPTILFASLGSVIGQSLLYGDFTETFCSIKFAEDVLCIRLLCYRLCR